jgi:hypothetical protein
MLTCISGGCGISTDLNLVIVVVTSAAMERHLLKVNKHTHTKTKKIKNTMQQLRLGG